MTAILDEEQAAPAPAPDPVVPVPESPDPDAGEDEDEGEDDADADPLHALVFEFDPRSWNVWETMEMRQWLGYKTREAFESVLEEHAELLQVGCAWLQIRKHHPEFAHLTPRELAGRVRGSQFVPPANPKRRRKS